MWRYVIRGPKEKRSLWVEGAEDLGQSTLHLCRQYRDDSLYLACFTGWSLIRLEKIRWEKKKKGAGGGEGKRKEQRLP